MNLLFHIFPCVLSRRHMGSQALIALIRNDRSLLFIYGGAHGFCVHCVHSLLELRVFAVVNVSWDRFIERDQEWKILSRMLYAVESALWGNWSKSSVSQIWHLYCVLFFCDLFLLFDFSKQLYGNFSNNNLWAFCVVQLKNGLSLCLM